MKFWTYARPECTIPVAVFLWLRGGGNCALSEVNFFAWFKVRFFRPKVLLANFRTSAHFPGCESSEIEILALDFSKSANFRSKVLFANFRTSAHFSKCESSEIELLTFGKFKLTRKVRVFSRKFYLRTFALFKSSKVRKKNFWPKIFSHGSKFAKVRSFPPL